MNYIYTVIAFYVSIFFILLAYSFKDKKISKLFFKIGTIAFFIAVMLFILWGVFRNFGVNK